MDIWLGDQRMRIFENLMVLGDGDVALVTITAPSLPWDTDLCTHPAGEKCGGARGCVVRADVATAWNVCAPGMFSAMHRAAAQSVRREYGAGVFKRLAYAPELQQRGVLHWHLVVNYSTPRERAAANFYAHELARLAPEYSFGYVDRGKRIRGQVRELEARPAWRAATYLSKYLTKVQGGSSLRELVVTQTAPPRPVGIHPELVKNSRCTARNLRRRRALWVRWRVRLDCRTCEAVFELERVFEGSVWDVPDGQVDDANAPPVAA